jgi:urease accessory protein
MNRKRTLGLIGTVLLALPATALAHPGHDGHELTWDFGTGLAHPLTGWDHLLAMVAVGLWAARLGGRARWLVPAAFIGAMAAGGMLGSSGATLPGAEQGIATSLFVLGLLVITGARLPLLAGMVLTAVFAAFHGLAHGSEAPANAGALGYGAGFVATTALLHLAGLGLGSAFAQRRTLFRIAGGIVAGAGVVAAVLA